MKTCKKPSVKGFSFVWDADSLDWKDLSAKEIYDRVTGKVKEGSIVLFHNAALHTPEALPMIIKNLQAKGYKFVKVSDLIYKENYMIDHAGKQHNNNKANSNNNS